MYWVVHKKHVVSLSVHLQAPPQSHGRPRGVWERAAVGEWMGVGRATSVQRPAGGSVGIGGGERVRRASSATEKELSSIHFLSRSRSPFRRSRDQWNK